MYLRKTIVLVALAALAATPSALALRPVEEVGVATTVVQHQPAVHPAKPKAKDKRPAYCTPAVPYCFAT